MMSLPQTRPPATAAAAAEAQPLKTQVSLQSLKPLFHKESLGRRGEVLSHVPLRVEVTDKTPMYPEKDLLKDLGCAGAPASGSGWLSFVLQARERGVLVNGDQETVAPKYVGVGGHEGSVVDIAKGSGAVKLAAHLVPVKHAAGGGALYGREDRRLSRATNVGRVLYVGDSAILGVSSAGLNVWDRVLKVHTVVCFPRAGLGCDAILAGYICGESSDVSICVVCGGGALKDGGGQGGLSLMAYQEKQKQWSSLSTASGRFKNKPRKPPIQTSQPDPSHLPYRPNPVYSAVSRVTDLTFLGMPSASGVLWVCAQVHSSMMEAHSALVRGRAGDCPMVFDRLTGIYLGGAATAPVRPPVRSDGTTATGSYFAESPDALSPEDEGTAVLSVVAFFAPLRSATDLSVMSASPVRVGAVYALAGTLASSVKSVKVRIADGHDMVRFCAAVNSSLSGQTQVVLLDFAACVSQLLTGQLEIPISPQCVSVQVPKAILSGVDSAQGGNSATLGVCSSLLPANVQAVRDVLFADNKWLMLFESGVVCFLGLTGDILPVIVNSVWMPCLIPWEAEMCAASGASATEGKSIKKGFSFSFAPSSRSRKPNRSRGPVSSSHHHGSGVDEDSPLYGPSIALGSAYWRIGGKHRFLWSGGGREICEVRLLPLDLLPRLAGHTDMRVYSPIDMIHHLEAAVCGGLAARSRQEFAQRFASELDIWALRLTAPQTERLLHVVAAVLIGCVYRCPGHAFALLRIMLSADMQSVRLAETLSFVGVQLCLAAGISLGFLGSLLPAEAAEKPSFQAGSSFSDTVRFWNMHLPAREERAARMLLADSTKARSNSAGGPVPKDKDALGVGLASHNIPKIHTRELGPSEQGAFRPASSDDKLRWMALLGCPCSESGFTDLIGRDRYGFALELLNLGMKRKTGTRTFARSRPSSIVASPTSHSDLARDDDSASKATGQSPDVRNASEADTRIVRRTETRPNSDFGGGPSSVGGFCEDENSCTWFWLHLHSAIALLRAGVFSVLPRRGDRLSSSCADCDDPDGPPIMQVRAPYLELSVLKYPIAQVFNARALPCLSSSERETLVRTLRHLQAAADCCADVEALTAVLWAIHVRCRLLASTAQLSPVGATHASFVRKSARVVQQAADVLSVRSVTGNASATESDDDDDNELCAWALRLLGVGDASWFGGLRVLQLSVLCLLDPAIPKAETGEVSEESLADYHPELRQRHQTSEEVEQLFVLYSQKATLLGSLAPRFRRVAHNLSKKSKSQILKSFISRSDTNVAGGRSSSQNCGEATAADPSTRSAAAAAEALYVDHEYNRFQQGVQDHLIKRSRFFHAARKSAYRYVRNLAASLAAFDDAAMARRLDLKTADPPSDQSGSSAGGYLVCDLRDKCRSVSRLLALH